MTKARKKINIAVMIHATVVQINLDQQELSEENNLIQLIKINNLEK